MSISQKLAKYDKASIGIIVALILLILGFLLSYFVKGYTTNIPLSRYTRYLFTGSPDRMDILIFSLLPNMLLFYFVNFQWRMYEFVKGLVAVSVIFCLIIVFLSL
ncbi:hypothetical protein DNU06_08385 [Putridiphycobacter roseus]|uniref:Uncharacterized protein n=1 Tax=Putridiphycobacter roseus TaxID=2219161 RepID=A0A2W1N2R7_9FLAO|nr:hypothetical protein [Putridiphycobacter roseus]PZE17281.1 hypothetical protein DNU06_08385 [Putridiphycobacter roseus]